MKIKTIRGHYGSNTFVVSHVGATIIIDAGATLEDVEKALDGVKPDAILLTHEHFDHVYYLDDYIKEFGCPVYNSGTGLKDERDIIIGDLIIKPVLCPGHSPHSVVYKIGESLFTGDVLFANTIGRTDLMPDGETIMQKSLRRLLGVKFDMAYHGHSRSSTYEEQQKNIKRFII